MFLDLAVEPSPSLLKFSQQSSPESLIALVVLIRSMNDCYTNSIEGYSPPITVQNNKNFKNLFYVHILALVFVTFGYVV